MANYLIELNHYFQYFGELDFIVKFLNPSESIFHPIRIRW